MDRDLLEERLLDLEQDTKEALGNFRFSIRGFMAVVLLAGIILATVKDYPDPFTTALGFVFALMVFGVLCTSILGILFRQGHRRAFWTGFAVFGWALLIFGFAILVRSFPLPVLWATLPFAYLGGLIARGFATKDDQPHL
jgi:hypothetical protein